MSWHTCLPQHQQRLGTTILQSNHIYKHDLIKSLFLRGYKLSESDTRFLKETEKGFEAARQIKRFEYYERLETEGAIDLVADNLNELFVIECAKVGKVELLGNGVQGAVWLANLAIMQYAKYWPIFFKKYDFYSQIFKSDGKGSFRKKQAEINGPVLESYPYFETLAKTLFPELKVDVGYPLASI